MENNNNEYAFLKTAEKVAQIVNEGIENNEISEISERIAREQSYSKQLDKLVYEPSNSAWSYIEIVLYSLFVVVILGYAAIGGLVISYSEKYKAKGMTMLSTMIVISIITIICIVTFMKRIRFNNRFKAYVSYFKYKRICMIDDIASYASLKKNRVYKDILKGMDLKYIPQAHVVANNEFVILSDEEYENYKEKEVFYNRYFRKQVEERSRMNERTPDMQEIMDRGQRYIDRIHESNVIIKDKVVSGKLKRMEDVVSMIFHEVDINPSESYRLSTLLEYYLPTTEKLLDTYMDIQEKKVITKSLQKTQKDIEHSLDSINDSFENVLEQFYRNQEIQLSSEIQVMEEMMTQDDISKLEDKYD